MNSIEKDIIKYSNNKNQVVFDVGCFRGTFTRKMIQCENQSGLNFNFFLFDPNPKVKDYLGNLVDNKKVMEHLSIDDIDSLFDYKLQLGLCPQFVDQIIKLTHTSRESDQQYFERYLSK